eukprot:TRINITY_DN63275_c0_g1_i1.p1 TRINITY_DN63275_c0_g1~~TRINITY_DN63275_c0_g1_i1.p1  ORF type:complete len:541 (+),score=91.92 TRINITY_DN63275_c0_g1_i1:109-1731(+)
MNFYAAWQNHLDKQPSELQHEAQGMVVDARVTTRESTDAARQEGTVQPLNYPKDANKERTRTHGQEQEPSEDPDVIAGSVTMKCTDGLAQECAAIETTEVSDAVNDLSLTAGLQGKQEDQPVGQNQQEPEDEPTCCNDHLSGDESPPKVPLTRICFPTNDTCKLSLWSLRKAAARAVQHTEESEVPLTSETPLAVTSANRALTILTKVAGDAECKPGTTGGRMPRVDWSFWRDAIRALGLAAQKGDQDTITALVDCIEHDLRHLKRDAVETLALIAEHGDTRVLCTVKKCLIDIDAHVRAAAVKTLVQLAERGDESVIIALGMLVKDSADEVRHASTCAIAGLAKHGDETTIALLTGCLGDAAWSIRLAALRAIADLSSRSNELVIAGITACLWDHNERVRQEAVRVLGQLVEKGDEGVTSSVLSELERGDRDVKIVAMQALAHAAGRGYRPVIDAVLKCLEDDEWTVRQEAVWTLPHIVEKDDEAAKDALARRVDDEELGVIIAAKSMLEKITNVDDKRLRRLAIVSSLNKIPKAMTLR